MDIGNRQADQSERYAFEENQDGLNTNVNNVVLAVEEQEVEHAQCVNSRPLTIGIVNVFPPKLHQIPRESIFCRCITFCHSLLTYLHPFVMRL